MAHGLSGIVFVKTKLNMIINKEYSTKYVLMVIYCVWLRSI